MYDFNYEVNQGEEANADLERNTGDDLNPKDNMCEYAYNPVDDPSEQVDLGLGDPECFCMDCQLKIQEDPCYWSCWHCGHILGNDECDLINSCDVCGKIPHWR